MSSSAETFLFDMSDLSPSDPFFNLARQLTSSPTQNSPSPSPAKKKNWRTGLPRDSLHNRYKIGKPGSKRYNRWEGEYRLRKFLSDTEDSMSESDQDFEKGWDECQEPSPGAFGDFFLDDELRETISPFLDITIEAEKIMLREICDSDSDSDYSSDDTEFDPLGAFHSLGTRSQRLLRKHKNSEFLLDLDAKLFAFAREDCQSSQSLKFCYEKAFHRQMVHAVSEFYGLISFSRDNQDGGRDTIVYKKTMTEMSESSSLSAFLLSHLNRNSFWQEVREQFVSEDTLWF